MNVIADGLEYIFATHDKAFPRLIQDLFEDDRKYFQTFQTDSFQLSAPPLRNSLLLSSMDVRSLILADQTAIDCLFKLYQFYELNSETVGVFVK